MTQSGYILAGFETLATIFDNFMLGKRGRWNDNFTRKEVGKFLAQSITGYLHSYGQNFHNKKKYEKYNANETGMYQKCRDMGFFDDCTLIADSGGFQISIGKLSRRESELLLKMYYEWIPEAAHVVDKFFILDVPPGPGCEIFKNFYDVYKLNLESYQKAKALPDELRKKMIYIHHFRTPKLWEIYTKIMRDYDMFDSFDYHGTGGIVANMASDMSIPCVIYVLPIIPLLNEAKRYGKKHLNFHILGGANFRDVLFYEMCQHAVKKMHGMDLNITYDSSGLYKQVMNARFLNVRDDEGYMRKMNVKSDNIGYRFNIPFGPPGSDRSIESIYQVIVDHVADKWGFKRISTDGVYDPDTKTFHEDVKAYSVLYTLNLYQEIQADMKVFAHESYKLYEQGNVEAFNDSCLEMTRLLNQGKLTKKQKIKSSSIAKSLDMLKNLDEDYCQYLITKHLAKDEFINLDEKTRILGF